MLIVNNQMYLRDQNIKDDLLLIEASVVQLLDNVADECTEGIFSSPEDWVEVLCPVTLP